MQSENNNTTNLNNNLSNNDNKIINISKNTFISVVCILYGLVILTIILTYIIPKGEFGTTIDATGETVTDYSNYIERTDIKGVNLLKGIFAPIMVLTSSAKVTLIALSIFLLSVAGAFQVMSDSNGMKAIVSKLIENFKDKKKLLVAIVTLIFMVFGSFFGMFEEVITLLPLIIMLSLSLGFDSYTGFLMCICGVGFGFATAITNPFTVVIASNLMDCSPTENIWFRIIAFIVVYGILISTILLHIKRIEKNPSCSPTFEIDNKKRNENMDFECENKKHLFLTYTIFLSLVLVTIVTVCSIESVRDYSVVFLIVLFLFGGFIAGYVATKDIKFVLKSFWKGVKSALPTIILVLLASSIKYVLEEGCVLATISNYINTLVSGKNPILVILFIHLLVLFLNFFISSSNAKVFFVMGILSCLSTGLSPRLMVLAYLFGDGYSNILFPTCPVLIIALSMTGMSYGKWLKYSKWLFLSCLIFVIAFLILGYYIHY